MDTDQPFTALTNEFAEAALAEREALQRRIADLLERAAVVERTAAALAAELAAEDQRLRRLDLVLGLAPQLELADGADALRGQRLREVAVDLLAERAPRDPIHYKQWYGWLAEQGYTVGGDDPLATFLVSVSRSPRIERVGARTGRYRLRADAARSSFARHARRGGCSTDHPRDGAHHPTDAG